VEISVAIGDLPNLPGTAALAALGAAVCGADYVKAGLFGVRSESEAITLLREIKDAVRQFGSSIVAGGYADFHRAGTLDPVYLVHAASLAGIRGCLLDTAIKDGRPLFDFVDPQQLQIMIEQAHSDGLLFGLAGALREQDLLIARDLGADLVGLRTAVCRDNQRNGPLEATRIQQMQNFVK
jgi:(5-formylfuran-3-yl)methyl phosphate synthase